MSVSEVITFPKGLPGFEDLKQFVLEEHNEVFSYLKSMDREEISFIVVDPFPFFKDYEFKAPEEALNDINYNHEKLSIRTIVTLHSDPQKITTNLLAPLIINEGNKQGKQIVLHDSEYTAKHPLWSESNKKSTESGDL